MKSLTAFPIALMIFLVMAMFTVLSMAGMAVMDACRAVDRKVDAAFNRKFADW